MAIRTIHPHYRFLRVRASSSSLQLRSSRKSWSVGGDTRVCAGRMLQAKNKSENSSTFDLFWWNKQAETRGKTTLANYGHLLRQRRPIRRYPIYSATLGGKSRQKSRRNAIDSVVTIPSSGITANQFVKTYQEHRERERERRHMESVALTMRNSSCQRAHGIKVV